MLGVFTFPRIPIRTAAVPEKNPGSVLVVFIVIRISIEIIIVPIVIYPFGGVRVCIWEA
jgi:hypothetical protein